MINADHPRSRGVYTSKGRPARSASGSSPLARGLPTTPASIPATPRIIPARAGFTIQPHSHRSESSGSSPLARGLPGGHTPGPAGRGIIPARAGFTRCGRPPSATGRDHPRSRGVYRDIQFHGRQAVGSSPLARGLLLAARNLGRRAGIIPARAGFTSAALSPDSAMRDHPRSRGVYPNTPSGIHVIVGSSPLARGLLGGRTAPAQEARIIPARAGFTPPTTSRRPQRTDHPRSRGVYASRAGPICPTPGSSPLARGLPDPARRVDRRPRIIPARAGFTKRPSTTSTSRADHPRSRGVYQRRLVSRLRDEGSSPLARGLRNYYPKGTHHVRIIPARAGFTHSIAYQYQAAEDHPRSRGVY